ncbi:Murein DD-endopeptidase MepM and murein hydrolase activator NlpD, contain LysM domain [Parafrankia irregularis]|uniref:Murein DD-endopeptidase MepM and murein hydrolase activator NlpD, contain LysM domain n=1 Tax=Parafrankia irregularis TaxID=795642 RepID=A0A0S4QFP8_9ACTN|nr:M23 family metallopeptidase [Parafrankia sp. CH37]CUU54373.1 Murein DD-endopeptidase MepM and murein hydrolase activator NlpD, contain LysM domain [Parafrankia irregularis]
MTRPPFPRSEHGTHPRRNASVADEWDESVPGRSGFVSVQLRRTGAATAVVSTIGLVLINATGIAHSETTAQHQPGRTGSTLAASASGASAGQSGTVQVVSTAGADDLSGPIDTEVSDDQRRMAELLEAKDLVATRVAAVALAQRDAAAAAEAERVAAARWVRPIEARVTQGFGGSNHHIGVDFGAPHGTTIHAAHRGTIIYAGWETGYGNFVQIMHENNVVTSYGHMSRIDVRVGQEVDTGEQIGLEGNTGKSTGPHLHFEVRLNGQYGTKVDPLAWLAGHGVTY